MSDYAKDVMREVRDYVKNITSVLPQVDDEREDALGRHLDSLQPVRKRTRIRVRKSEEDKQ